MKNEWEEKKLDLLSRSKELALRIIRLYVALPKTTEAQVIGKQLLRAGTSVGAHLRESKRSRSNAEMISKTEGALQELEEAIYWLELLSESGMMNPDRLKPLMETGDELSAILVSGVKKLKARKTTMPTRSL
ncbi:four helix bundle protein [bacterium]|nr:four helix bundle protein [bacterium]